MPQIDERAARPLDTADVLVDEFAAVHGRNLREEYELEHGVGAWERFPTAEAEYRAAGRDWCALTHEAQAKERKKARERYYFGEVHRLKKNDKAPGQTGLCLSGGGIRSAAFALGLMQGLARRGLLSQFDYLSTVSGGGYIGGWLTAWSTRVTVKEGEDARQRGAEPRPAFPEIEKALAATQTTPEPMRALRQNQAYLTPKVGLSSPDTWATVAIVIRNLLLNWLVFIPFLASVLLIPRFVEWLFIYWVDTSPHTGPLLLKLMDWALGLFRGQISTLDVAWDPHTWLDAVGTALVVSGLVSAMTNRSEPDERAIDDRGFVRCALIPIVAGALVLVAQTCTWLPASEANPRPEMFWQWMGGCAFAFVLARLLSLLFIQWREAADPELNTRSVLLELAAHSVSGLVIGALIWSGLYLRAKAIGANFQAPEIDAVFGTPWYLASFLIGQVMLAGLTSRLYPKSGDHFREWWARASGWHGFVALNWLFLFGLVIYGALLSEEGYKWLLAATGATGVVSLLGASPLTSTIRDGMKVGALTLSRLVTLASLTFSLLLAIWLSEGTKRLLEAVGIATLSPADATGHAGPALAAHALAQLGWITLAIIGLFALSQIASFFVNVNYFSLNGMYRNRLIRAFLGASNLTSVTGKLPGRNPFDGIAESDNFPIADLRPTREAGPFPIVNITLNLTATDNKAWQERKAAAFIATPLHCGGDLVGYRPAKQYGNGISLGTALSLSGAAASPNWGYHSSPLTSFIMAIFNVRLGAWLGNPKHPTCWSKGGPTRGSQLFLQEALGQTTADGPFVYLSDGGHFDNLGLYEMVRRRCHVIVVSDAAADPDCTLEDLGNAIRKIYIDLGVKIDFERVDVRKRDKDPANPGVYCAVGNVIYPEPGAKPCQIVYIKPGFYDDAPADVRAFAAANAKFPHDSTLNQWFTESQFESYRALGEHAVSMIASRRDQSGNILYPQPAAPQLVDLLDLTERAEAYLRCYRDVGKPRARPAA